MPGRPSPIGPRKTAALVALLVAVTTVAVAGCGRDDEGGGAGGRSLDQSSQEAVPRSGGEDETSDPDAISETVRGFGSEAGARYGEEIVAVVRSYFSALAKGRHTEACSHMSSSFRRTLSRALQPERAREAGCEALGQMLAADSNLPIGAADAASRARIVGVRVAGRNAVVLYRPEGGEPSFLTLIREGGRWKATSLAGAPLP